MGTFLRYSCAVYVLKELYVHLCTTLYLHLPPPDVALYHQTLQTKTPQHFTLSLRYHHSRPCYEDVWHSTKATLTSQHHHKHPAWPELYSDFASTLFSRNVLPSTPKCSSVSAWRFSKPLSCSRPFASFLLALWCSGGLDDLPVSLYLRLYVSFSLSVSLFLSLSSVV